MSLIIPNVQHFCSPFSFLLKKRRRKKCEYNIPLEIAFLEGCPLEIFGRFSTPGFFFESRCHLQACIDCEYLVTISTGFKAAVVCNGHKAAAFLLYQIWLLGQQSLTGSGVPRL